MHSVRMATAIVEEQYLSLFGGSLEDALREQKREDAEKEAAKKDQEKAHWDTPEEWAWHDAHAEGWAAAADEEKQNAAERSGSAAEGLDSSESETLQMDSHPSIFVSKKASQIKKHLQHFIQVLMVFGKFVGPILLPKSYHNDSKIRSELR